MMRVSANLAERGLAPAAATVADFDAKVASRTLRVGIVGLGYTGLPLACGFAAAGLRVVGHDIDPDKVASVNLGQSYLPDLADEDLGAVRDRLSAVVDPSGLAGVDAVIVSVPTPVIDGNADLTYVDAALAAVAPHLRKGALLVLQSTIPPGTTSAAARRLGALNGLRIGLDVHVAMAPERIDPANERGWNLANTPKLVGGLTPECTRRASLLFEQVCATVVPVSSPEVAELAKVFENTFRLVNIALTLELSDICRDLRIPVREVIDAAATKPYGFLAHYPGPGVGGECIPVDPLFLRPLARRAGTDLSIVESAHRRIVNRPVQIVERVRDLLASRDRPLDGARILVVGVSYKEGVADLRNAPALDVIRGLARAGATVGYHDPMVPSLVVDGIPVRPLGWEPECLAEHDCVILITPHAGIAADPGWSIASLVLDTRNVLAPAPNVEIL